MVIVEVLSIFTLPTTRLHSPLLFVSFVHPSLPSTSLLSLSLSPTLPSLTIFLISYGGSCYFAFHAYIDLFTKHLRWSGSFRPFSTYTTIEDVFRKEPANLYLPGCASVSLRWRSWDARLLRRTRYTTTRTTHSTEHHSISRTPRSTIAGLDQQMDHSLTPCPRPNPHRHRRPSQ